MFDNLESIDFMSDSWKIIVRITRMWPTFSKLNDKFIGMNMIFLDSQVQHYTQLYHRSLFVIAL